MSKFDDAISIVLKHEGGYTANPKDAGGPTKYGISLRFLVEEENKESRFYFEHEFSISDHPTAIDIKRLNYDQVKKIYYKYFWVPGNFEVIATRPLCFKAFDLSVTMGTKQLIELLQCAVNHVSLYNCVSVDGKLGTLTTLAVNLASPGPLYDAFIAECSTFYKNLAASKPQNEIFLAGWLNRVRELPDITS